MEKELEKKIISEIEEKHGNIHTVLRLRKQAQGYTLQDVSDGTGISFDNVSKFFSGKLKNPNVYNVMALCIFLKESLDSLLGNPYGNSDNLAHNAEIADLKAEIKSLKKELEYTERLLTEKENHSKVLSDGIRVRRIIIYSLMAICVVLGALLIHYIRLDTANPHTVTSPVIIPILIVTLAAVVLVAILEGRALRRRKYEKEDD